MCGEQDICAIRARRAMGSPPRVRGTGKYMNIQGLTFRITPACAGNRARKRSYKSIIGDHPRVCGEQKQLVPEWVQEKGSPPRVRGTGRGYLREPGRGRITPACAGNSSLTEETILAAEDHPRVCGEQTALSLDMRVEGGSPPRVRGTVPYSSGKSRTGRIIPACAGNRGHGVRLLRAGGDHPRVCGEQPSSKTTPPSTSGSPPRVRGTACAL